MRVMRNSERLYGEDKVQLAGNSLLQKMKTLYAEYLQSSPKYPWKVEKDYEIKVRTDLVFVWGDEGIIRWTKQSG